MSDHGTSNAVNHMLARLYFTNKAFQTLTLEEKRGSSLSMGGKIVYN